MVLLIRDPSKVIQDLRNTFSVGKWNVRGPSHMYEEVEPRNKHGFNQCRVSDLQQAFYDRKQIKIEEASKKYMTQSRF